MLTRFAARKAIFLWLILLGLGLSGCGGGDSSVQPIASVKTNAPTVPDPALIPTDTVITLTYNESMVPASLALGGDMAGESNGGIWSTTHVTNDTLTISPTSNWTARTGRHLTIDAKDTAGRAARTVDLAYDVYRGTLYYVNAVTGNDSNAGMTPTMPFLNIYTAVNTIAASATILVAGGTYPVASTDTRIYLRQDISLYGGYKSDFSVRDPATYPSTIQDSTSAVAGTNANPNFAINADNNYAVSKDGTGSTITNTTLVDGFTISGTLSTAANYTTAIRVLNGAAPAFANDQIYGGKGAIQSIGIDAVNAAPLIYSNVINGGAGPTSPTPTASTLTYGIYVSGASPRIINNLIHGGDNTVASYAYYLSNGAGVLRNNILSGGTGTTSSTAVSLVAGSSGTTNPNIDNNILFTRTGSGSTCIHESTSGGSATPASLRNNDLYNCTVVYYDADAACTGNADLDNNNNTCTLSEINALTDFAGGVSANISVDPLFASLTGPDTLISTMHDNNWHFSTSSPASVTAGGLNGIDQGWSYTTDKDGVSRPASGKPWSIGAYEP